MRNRNQPPQTPQDDKPAPYEIPWPDLHEVGFVDKKAVIELIDGTVEEYDEIKLNGDGTVTCFNIQFSAVNVSEQQRRYDKDTKRWREGLFPSASYTKYWADDKHIHHINVKTYGYGAWKCVAPGVISWKTYWADRTKD